MPGRGLRGVWTVLVAAGLLCGARQVLAQTSRPQRLELENGLILLHQPNPSALTAAVCCFIKVSALVETRSTAGLRNLTQQTLLDIPDEQGRRLEERLGDYCLEGTVQTSPDYVEAMFQGTADQLPELLHCVRLLLGGGKPDPRQVTLRRKEALRQLEERRELPVPVARDMAQAHLYADTPCAWPTAGTFAVGTLEPEQLLALRRMRYAPNRAVVAVSGNVTWEQCRQQAQQALGDLLPRPVPAEPEATVSRPSRALLYQPWEGENAVVLLATPCPGPDHPEFAAATVLNAVLGGGEGSRLFSVLRDQAGLSYSIVSNVTPSRLCGTIGISVTCEPKQAAAVFQIMQSEVAALRSRPPSDSEVQRAKAYLTSSYVLGHQRNAEVAHYLGLFELQLPGQREAGLAEMVSSVTPAQVVSATNWLLDRTVWVQVGGRQP